MPLKSYPMPSGKGTNLKIAKMRDSPHRDCKPRRIESGEPPEFTQARSFHAQINVSQVTQ